MLRDILLKTLHDQRRGLLAWTVSLVLLVAMYAALWPSIRDQPSMSQFLQNMPEAMRALFASSGADMSTPTGYVQVELLSFMGPMLLLIYAITTGAAGVAGEEDRHTLELLMANPVSRTRVVLEKFGALVVGTALLGLATGLALVLEGRLAGLDLPVGNVAAAMLHLTLLALVFGALAAAIGGLTGHGGASRAIPAVVAVVAYVLNGLAPVVSWLKPAQKFSPFFQYLGHDPLRNGISAPAILTAVVTVAVLVVVAVLGFRRRDLAG
ncbi:ABC transporter permease subunit [Amycolatopsis benzoatilytica]|uniref:ABC transporter permease subunit n=1 Tax=Amycolatopsis benzoatilytica TaxID=346045 RepID=UPI00039C5522|nr:ABC transporter permease subunit [Amycolatopsis benzoatilytica]